MSDLDRNERFKRGEEFFSRKGSAWMKMSREAAHKAVEQCTLRSDAVSIIEGGVWHNPGFEARLDAIWHSKFDKRPDGNSLIENNAAALSFLAEEMPAECDTAIVSVFKDRND